MQLDVILHLLSNSPIAIAVIYLVVRFAKYMNEQRDFFFGEKGYITRRDEAFVKMMQEVSENQKETANMLHKICRHPG